MPTPVEGGGKKDDGKNDEVGKPVCGDGTCADKEECSLDCSPFSKECADDSIACGVGGKNSLTCPEQCNPTEDPPELECAAGTKTQTGCLGEGAGGCYFKGCSTDGKFLACEALTGTELANACGGANYTCNPTSGKCEFVPAACGTHPSGSTYTQTCQTGSGAAGTKQCSCNNGFQGCGACTPNPVCQPGTIRSCGSNCETQTCQADGQYGACKASCTSSQACFNNTCKAKICTPGEHISVTSPTNDSPSNISCYYRLCVDNGTAKSSVLSMAAKTFADVTAWCTKIGQPTGYQYSCNDTIAPNSCHKACTYLGNTYYHNQVITSCTGQAGDRERKCNNGVVTSVTCAF